MELVVNLYILAFWFKRKCWFRVITFVNKSHFLFLWQWSSINAFQIVFIMTKNLCFSEWILWLYFDLLLQLLPSRINHFSCGLSLWIAWNPEFFFKVRVNWTDMLLDWGFPGGSTGKESLAMQETPVRFLGFSWFLYASLLNGC